MLTSALSAFLGHTPTTSSPSTLLTQHNSHITHTVTQHTHNTQQSHNTTCRYSSFKVVNAIIYKCQNDIIAYLVQEAHVILLMTSDDVICLPDATSKTSLSYTPVLTWIIHNAPPMDSPQPVTSHTSQKHIYVCTHNCDTYTPAKLHTCHTTEHWYYYRWLRCIVYDVNSMCTCVHVYMLTQVGVSDSREMQEREVWKR